MKPSTIELPSNRKFGLFFASIFAVAALYFANYFNKESTYITAWIFTGLALIFVTLALTKPAMLLPLNKLWMGFGLLLGKIISPIVLGAIFFLIFTPTGFFMRLFGRDELRLKTKPIPSYWKARETGQSSANSFKHQF